MALLPADIAIISQSTVLTVDQAWGYLVEGHKTPGCTSAGLSYEHFRWPGQSAYSIWP